MTSVVTSYSDSRPAVLVVSGQDAVRVDVVQNLQSANWRTLEANGGADALACLEESDCRVLLLDHALPDIETGEMCEIAQSRFPDLDVVVLDPSEGAVSASCSSSRMATELIHLLADKGTKAASPALPRFGPTNTNGKAARSPLAEQLPGMVGDSPNMCRVYEHVRLVSPRTTPVLITGATGTGKELIAAAIHGLSARARKPLVTINCAAIPEPLLESELFGYVRGAFTGAVQSRVGRIHAAHGGTLFLDEIGEMPVNLQAKLLRFLENGEVQRLGSVDVLRVDARVIAATNVDLEHKVKTGTFREDLYYRLSVFPIPLPPLRERGNDVLKLAEHFLSGLSPHPVLLSPEAVERLRQHDWPGNVRELRHVMERASILASDSPIIHAEHIVLQCRAA